MLTQLLGGVNVFGIPTDEFLMIKADQDEGTVIPKPTKIYPLWRLTLWMTFDRLLRINVADDPIADKGAPRYTAWDMELLMKFFHGPKEKIGNISIAILLANWLAYQCCYKIFCRSICYSLANRFSLRDILLLSICLPFSRLVLSFRWIIFHSVTMDRDTDLAVVLTIKNGRHSE
jgi:hypothetical protein